jgi:MYXO-CTERM domain-containing protein
MDDPDCPDETVDACGPLAAAFYWRLAHRDCPDCVVVAGEFDSVPNDRYVLEYQRYLRDHRPKVWSTHPHTDANRFADNGDDSAPATHAFLAQLQGTWATASDGSPSHVWLTEVGSYFRREPGNVPGEARQRAGTAFILGLPSISPRITRIYYYNYQNRCSTAGRCADQDRGLVSPAPWDGGSVDYDARDRVRDAFSIIADRGDVPPPCEMAPPPPPPPDAAPPPPPDAAPPPPDAAVVDAAAASPDLGPTCGPEGCAPSPDADAAGLAVDAAALPDDGAPADGEAEASAVRGSSGCAAAPSGGPFALLALLAFTRRRRSRARR